MNRSKQTTSMLKIWKGAVIAASIITVLAAAGATRASISDWANQRTAAPASDHPELPMIFEANHGQTNPEVRFLWRGEGHTLFLTPKEAVLVRQKAPGRHDTTGEAIRMKWPGSSSEPVVEGLDPHPGVISYLRGRDSAQWITEIPNYARVRYRQVYPGVDLVFYGNEGQLEYDFVLAPGADLRSLRLEFEGVTDMRVDASGDLVLRTSEDELRQRKPYIYQERQGTRQDVQGRYRIDEDHRVHFEVGHHYDSRLPLVIDPVLAFSTYLGTDVTCCDDEGPAIAVDPSGNVYLTGSTTFAPFPITAGAYQTTYAGQYTDCFVAKLSPTGHLIYATYLGGSSADRATAIAVDEYRNAYVTGITQSADFPTSMNAFQSALNTLGNLWSDAFVTKLNAAGSGLIYSTYLGSSGPDQGNSIAVLKIVPPSGAYPKPQYVAYVTGQTFASNFPTTRGALKPGTASTASLTNPDAFVVKLNPFGTGLYYSTYLGGEGPDSGHGIAVNSAGNAYITGTTASQAFFPPAQGLQSTLRGPNDAFVVRLFPDGSFYDFSTYLGGSSVDNGWSIAVDAKDDAYITGRTLSPDFWITPGALQTALGDSGQYGDAFVTKLNGKGTFLYYSTFLGHDYYDVGRGIAVDPAGNAYVAGTSRSTMFPTTADALRPLNTSEIIFDGFPQSDAFVIKLNPTGSNLIYSTLLGGLLFDEGLGVAINPWCATCKTKMVINVVGRTNSSDLPTAADVAQPAKQGSSLSYNAFVFKLNP